MHVDAAQPDGAPGQHALDEPVAGGAPAGTPNLEQLCPVAMLGWVSGVTPGLMPTGVIDARHEPSPLISPPRPPPASASPHHNLLPAAPPRRLNPPPSR